MKVIDIQLHKDKLLKVPDLERTLFLALGHAANEINALTKMLYWAANAPARNDAEDRGRLTMLLLLIRLLAGKLNEYWELLQKKYFGTSLSHNFEPKLDDKAKAALKSLKNYFGRKNACNRIRNHFAFHYSPEEIAAMLPGMTEELHIYMEREAVQNSLYAFSEALLSKALLVLLDGAPASLEDLVGGLFNVALWFAQVTDSLMFGIIDALGEEIRSAQPNEVHFESLPDFDSVALSWFTNTSNTTNP